MSRKVVRFKLSSDPRSPGPAQSLRNVDEWVSNGGAALEVNPSDRTTYAAILELTPKAGPTVDGREELAPSTQVSTTGDRITLLDLCNEVSRDLVDANLDYLRSCYASFGSFSQFLTPWGVASYQSRLARDTMAHILSTTSRAAATWAKRTEEMAESIRRPTSLPRESPPRPQLAAGW